MSMHHCSGYGPDTTQDDFNFVGRAERIRLITWDLTTSNNATDPMTAQKWFLNRPRIDEATRREILTTLFPPRRRARRAISAEAASA